MGKPFLINRAGRWIRDQSLSYKIMLPALLLTLALLPLSTAEENCKIALTVKGLGDLDGDWMMTSEMKEGGNMFTLRTGQFIVNGCLLCNETEKELAKSKWVMSARADEDRYAHLVAICTDGCPDNGEFWPLAWNSKGMKWKRM